MDKSEVSSLLKTHTGFCVIRIDDAWLVRQVGLTIRLWYLRNLRDAYKKKVGDAHTGGLLADES